MYVLWPDRLFCFDHKGPLPSNLPGVNHQLESPPLSWALSVHHSYIPTYLYGLFFKDKTHFHYNPLVYYLCPGIAGVVIIRRLHCSLPLGHPPSRLTLPMMLPPAALTNRLASLPISAHSPFTFQNHSDFTGFTSCITVCTIDFGKHHSKMLYVNV